MKSFYLIQKGKLLQRDSSLTFLGDEEIDIPIHQVDDLHIMHKTEISTECLKLLMKHNICIHYYDSFENYLGSTIPKESQANGALTVMQVKNYLDEDLRIKIAKKFVLGAARNISKVLKYYLRENDELNGTIDKIDLLMTEVDSVYSVDRLLGIEGNIRKEYYSCWGVILGGLKEPFCRIYNPAPDLINGLVSFCNSLLYSCTLSEIYKTTLFPNISYLHQPSSGRNSLIYDLSEIFKPIFVDRLVFTLINKKMLKEEDFYKDTFKLDKEKVKLVLEEWGKVLDTIIYHRKLKRNVSYRYLIRLEAYKLIKHFEGEQEYDPFVLWW